MSTLLAITVAILMVAVAIGIVMAVRRYQLAASARRMRQMMTNVGLGTDITANADPEIQEIMQQVRQRCRKCMSEDMCERWLRGEVGGRNAFCPNAKVFEGLLTRTAAHAA